MADDNPPSQIGESPSPAQKSTPSLAVSRPAQDTREQDMLQMGRTARQRTAEVFAGLRAELLQTPETIALARLTGRISARLMISLASKKVINFILVRSESFAGLATQALGSDLNGKVLVDIAAGFSPRGLATAVANPDLQVIEIDLPDVVEEKQKRLAKGQIAIPPNLKWKAADLGVQPLAEVLDHQQVDVVTAEGLMPYFEYPDITRIARYVYQSLKQDGVLIADLGYIDQQVLRDAGQLVKIFRRYTSSTPGAVNDEKTAFKLFHDAGYEHVDLYRIQQTAQMFNLSGPVADMLFFMVAQRQK